MSQLSVVPPGDDGVVCSSGFTGGGETETTCSGEFLLVILEKEKINQSGE